MKICTKCKVEKTLSCFSKDKKMKDGLLIYCKPCISEKKKLNRLKNIDVYKKREAKIRALNKDKIIEYHKRYYLKNKTNIQKKASKYNQRSDRVEWRRAYNKSDIYKTKRNELNKLLRTTDPMFRLRNCIRRRINHVFTSIGDKKEIKSISILGASFLIVKKHIERQFKKGMSWNNHGRGKDKWHMDHIIPLASATTKEDVVSLCHYTNLQPLWEIDNLVKGTKAYGAQIKLYI